MMRFNFKNYWVMIESYSYITKVDNNMYIGGLVYNHLMVINNCNHHNETNPYTSYQEKDYLMPNLSVFDVVDGQIPK